MFDLCCHRDLTQYFSSPDFEPALIVMLIVRIVQKLQPVLDDIMQTLDSDCLFLRLNRDCLLSRIIETVQSAIHLTLCSKEGGVCLEYGRGLLGDGFMIMSVYTRVC